jgi:GNAT superfamily N-acetyltransferase
VSANATRRRGSLRLAVPADSTAIAEVMVASARELSRGFYSEEQIPSVLAHVAILDPVLIEDGTYFVIEDVLEDALEDAHRDRRLGEGGRDEASAPDTVAACGGWSRRDKLFSGGGAAAGGAGFLTPGRDPARIRAMFVHPRAARRGFGRAILEASEAAALAAGFRDAELMATAPGIPLYLAAGYRVLEPVEVPLPDGCVIACARMHKSLGGR